MAIDLRASLNAISDVVDNRPRPLREFDQIFMKSADMLLQTELVGRWFNNKDVVFIGDGDAISLCLVHLYNNSHLKHGPHYVHVLDFDERIVLSIQRFAERFGITDKITSELYNVADPLPERLWQRFHGFYTNPPFGASNGGNSIEAFCMRGVEAVGENAIGCLVLADHPSYNWTQEIIYVTQKNLLEKGFAVVELLPEFHHYHLDDAPDLTSCSMMVRRIRFKKREYSSNPLSKGMLLNFYGKNSPLIVKFVRDLSNGGKLPSRDHRFEPIEKGAYK